MILLLGHLGAVAWARAPMRAVSASTSATGTPRADTPRRPRVARFASRIERPSSSATFFSSAPRVTLAPRAPAKRLHRNRRRPKFHLFKKKKRQDGSHGHNRPIMGSVLLPDPPLRLVRRRGHRRPRTSWRRCPLRPPRPARPRGIDAGVHARGPRGPWCTTWARRGRAPRWWRQSRSTALEGDGKRTAAFEIKAVAWDEACGGEDMDMVLVDHFAAEFDAARAPSAPGGRPRAVSKLRKQARKTKEILSANKEAPISVEGMHEDHDFRSSIKRSELLRSSTEAADKSVRCARCGRSRRRLPEHGVTLGASRWWRSSAARRACRSSNRRCRTRLAGARWTAPGRGRGGRHGRRLVRGEHVHDVPDAQVPRRTRRRTGSR